MIVWTLLRPWLLKTMFVLAILPQTSSGCPKSCACYVPTEVHCTFKYLTEIPGQIQSVVERINLGYNTITVLRENDFSGLEHLELLMLHSNTIHSIEDRAFQELRSLQVLKMSYNKVKEINKETFKGLEGLLRLHMDHNRIEFINPEALYGLTKLQWVHLEGNQLQQLHPDTFITLRHSQVFKVSSVRNIYLADNLLTSLPADLFSGCYQLENVYLHGNHWSCDCHMKWFPQWVQRNPDVLKCKKDKKYARGQLCPVCESPTILRHTAISQLTSEAFSCTKPWIYSHLKQTNITLDEGDFTPVQPKDFIAPLGSMQLNLTDEFHNDASLSCTVQRLSTMENLTLTIEEEGESNVTMLTTGTSTSLVCNVDHEHIQILWRILATYSDTPMRLERGLMLARSPEMVYRYSQIRPEHGNEEIHTGIEAEIKASPAWLMQGEISFQLDRTTTTFSTLHIKYRSVVNLRVENRAPRKERYSWSLIKRHNQTKTEHNILIGGAAELQCEVLGEPKPSVEWILADGIKVRAPFSSEDRRIIITAEGKLTLRGADVSDTGLYRCIATNYLDADILSFRLMVLSHGVEETEVNGVQLSRPLGQDMFLDCGASGSPAASIQWILPDQTVLDESHGSRKLFKNGTLGIQSLTARDRGFYRCLAANHMGVDLLVSQVTITGEATDSVSVSDNEGSGMGSENSVNGDLAKKEVFLNEIPSSSSSNRSRQEFRTITSARPYPRIRSQSKVGQDARHWQRRGPISNRRIWSNRRVFDQTKKKVDPQKFAELMKKAQSSLKLGIVNGREKIIYQDLDTGLSGDDEIGSSVHHNEVAILAGTVTITANPQQSQSTITMLLINNNSTNGMVSMESTQNLMKNVLTTTSKGVMELKEIPEDIPVGDTVVTQSTDTRTTEPFTNKQTVTYSMERESEIPSDAVSPYVTLVDDTTKPRVTELKDFHALERATNTPTNTHPVTLRLTVTDNSENIELHFSGEPPAKPESSTRAEVPLVTDANITPMMDGPGPMNVNIHGSNDPEHQTTFTAITTTERDQDEITFHTTQRIKSPRFPAGSTIISHQQIHIIPPMKGRGQGRKRLFQGRRRIIKPNRITDIQSIITKLKQPTLRRKGNATVPYTVKLTTDCDANRKESTTSHLKAVTNTSPSPSRKTESPGSTLNTAATTKQYVMSKVPTIYTPSTPKVSNGFITSADSPEVDPTTDSYVIVTEKMFPLTITTTTSSKVMRGRIPWNRLFGGKDRHKEILEKLRKALTTAQTLSTVEPTTTTPSTSSPLTSSTLVEPEAVSIFKYRESTESSTDDDIGDVFSAEFELTTPQRGLYHQTTTTSSYSTFSTTADTPPETRTIASPPTVKPPSRTNPDETSASGSGGYSGRLKIKQRPGGKRGRLGRRKRPSISRKPFRKTTTTVSPKTATTDTIMKSTTELITPTHRTGSFSRQLHIPYGEEDRSVSTSLDSEKQTETHVEDDRKVFTYHHSEDYSTTKIPRFTSTTIVPATTYKPPTTEWSFNTPKRRVQSNIINKTERNSVSTTQRPKIRRVQPIVSSKRAMASTEIPLSFDTLTIFKAGQIYTNTPPPYNSKDIDNAKYLVTGHEATTVGIVWVEPSVKDMHIKPRIVGGNAASFNVLSSSDAFLPCEAAGNPQPTISWRRFSTSTGNTVTIKGKMGRFEVFSNGTLSIQNANIKDRGQYLCLAENNQGSDKLLVTLSVVAYPSRILEPKMREITSHVGTTVEMKCNAEGRPTPMISWILANRTQIRVHKTDQGRASVTSEGTLVIEQVSVFDRGHYKCIASNPAGADTATVRLQVVADPPGILEEKRQQVKASTRQSLWLPCTGQGYPLPSIHWVLYNGSVVQPNRPSVDRRVSVYENGTLYLNYPTLTDSGKYECIATSSTGSERRVVTLTVIKQESAPIIVETTQHWTELSFGDQLALNCSATGDPKPRIIWRVPSKAVVDQWHRMGSRIQVLDNGTLIINSVSDKDAGDYLCVARSSIGDDLQLMKVSVSMKPARIEPKFYGKKQVPLGNDFKVDCKASGAPEPEISWGLPDGTVVNSALQADSSSGRGGRRTRRYTLFDNGTLYVNEVGMSEEGDYTCYAENRLGKDEMHVHITVVTAAPRVRPPAQTYAKVKPGGNIRFDCEAVGEPKPKILWMLPTNDIIAASNERYLMHVNGSLEIRDVKLVDAGMYMCVARNPAGESSNVYELSIDGNPPVINGYRQNRTVVKYSAAKYTRTLIDCKAEGDPPPTVTWIMPDNIFLTAPYVGSRINIHHNGTLEIRNVRPTDTAEFICMAKNDEGEAVMVVQLEVISKAQRPIFKNPFNERIVSRLGKAVVLNCSASGHPTPELLWTLPNGTRLVGGPYRGSRHHLGNDGTLVIYNPAKEDSGKYRCAAKNFIGYIEKAIILEVGHKPYILTRPRGVIRSVSGEPLFLHCLTDGSPRPRISWTIPGVHHTLTRPQVYGRYHFLDNGTLVVQGTTYHDRGNYICNAQNDAGEATLIVPVIIIAYTPRITTGPPPSVRAMAGVPIQLNCAAIGIPKPDISWEWPDHSVLSTAGQGRPMGSELLHPQGTLVIQRPKASDSGTYRCLAKNYLGTDSKGTYVSVQ